MALPELDPEQYLIIFEWVYSRYKDGHPPTQWELRNYASTTFHLKTLPSEIWPAVFFEKYPEARSYMYSCALGTLQQKSDIVQWIYSQTENDRAPTNAQIREYASKILPSKQKPSKRWAEQLIRQEPGLREFLRLAESYQRTLSPEQETVLVNCIKHHYNLGFPLTTAEIAKLVTSVKKHLRPTKRWFNGFFNRHPGVREFIAYAYARLNRKEEYDIAQWMLSRHSQGFTPKIDEVIERANKVAKANGSTRIMGRLWFDGFAKRQQVVNEMLLCQGAE